MTMRHSAALTTFGSRSAIIFPLLLSGCSLPGGTNLTACENPMMKVGEVSLPSAATNVNCEYSHWQETLIYTHFTAPREDARAFAATVLGDDLVAGDELQRSETISQMAIRSETAEEMGISGWWLNEGEAFSYGGTTEDEAGDIQINVLVADRPEKSEVWVLILDF